MIAKVRRRAASARTGSRSAVAPSAAAGSAPVNEVGPAPGAATVVALSSVESKPDNHSSAAWAGTPRRRGRPRRTRRSDFDYYRQDHGCLLYTSDAADDLTRVDLGGR